MPSDATLPPDPPAPPPDRPGETPADRALRAEGGEILPSELGAKPPSPASPTFADARPVPTPGSAPATITASAVARDLPATPRGVLTPGGPPPPGMSAPGATPEAPEQVRLVQQINAEINFELNVLNMCYAATHNFVNQWLASQPPDSAELAESTFGPGKRTPIETLEPELALEVYRQVRVNMRSWTRQPRADALGILGEGINAALVALAGRGPK